MLNSLFSGLIALIYPAKCTCCKKSVDENNIICKDCIASIKKINPPFCEKCGAPINSLLNCPTCKNHENITIKRSWSVCHFNETIKETIHAFKYKGRKKLRKIFINLLINYAESSNMPLAELDYVVPVPLHKSRLREREFNQSGILAKGFADKFQIDYEPNLLKRIKNTQFQANLSRLERQTNLKDSFSINDKLKIVAKNFLIIDDVFTTGTTVKEIAKTLKKHGADSIYCLTLAR